MIQERELDYITAARLRNESGLYIMLFELLPERVVAVMVEFTVRLRYAVFTVATPIVPGLRHSAADPLTGATTSPTTSRSSPPGIGGRCCSPRARSPRL